MIAEETLDHLSFVNFSEDEADEERPADIIAENVVNSPYFYLQQNDVIYVEPNKVRKDNSKYNQNNSFRIQVVSTVVSLASVISSLLIALVINNR